MSSEMIPELDTQPSEKYYATSEMGWACIYLVVQNFEVMNANLLGIIYTK